MSRTRDEAEALAGALELGLCDIPEVIAWADAQIAREDQPSEALCDVALARGRYPQDVAGLLRRFPGAPEKAETVRLVLTLMRERLNREDEAAEPIARMLHQMEHGGEIDNPQLMEIARWAWLVFDPWDCDYTEESRDETVRQMVDALTEATTKTPTAWSSLVIAEKPDPRRSPERQPPAQPSPSAQSAPPRSRFLRILKFRGRSR